MVPGVERANARADRAAGWAHVHTNLPHSPKLALAHGLPASDVLVSALAAYLARVTGQNAFTLGFRDRELARTVAGAESLFAAVVPLGVEALPEQSFGEATQRLTASPRLLRSRPPLPDVPHRTSRRDLQRGLVQTGSGTLSLGRWVRFFGSGRSTMRATRS